MYVNFSVIAESVRRALSESVDWYLCLTIQMVTLLTSDFHDKPGRSVIEQIGGAGIIFYELNAVNGNMNAMFSFRQRFSTQKYDHQTIISNANTMVTMDLGTAIDFKFFFHNAPRKIQ
jgi:hypothetical protein